MHLDDPVHNGDVPAPDFENEDFSRLDWLRVVVGEKEEVPAIKSWLHATTVCVCVCVYCVCECVYCVCVCVCARMCVHMRYICVAFNCAQEEHVVITCTCVGCHIHVISTMQQ